MVEAGRGIEVLRKGEKNMEGTGGKRSGREERWTRGRWKKWCILG